LSILLIVIIGVVKEDKDNTNMTMMKEKLDSRPHNQCMDSFELDWKAKYLLALEIVMSRRSYPALKFSISVCYIC